MSTCTAPAGYDIEASRQVANAGCLNLFALPRSPSTKAWPAVITAWLDELDRVVHLPEAWDTFVNQMELGDVHRETILGRPVGWFIEDDTTRECFRALFMRVRRDGRTARILARCDAEPRGPARALQLSFVPHSVGAIAISWHFLHGSHAELVPQIRRRRMADGELIRACGWCRDVQLNIAWQRLDQAAPALGLLDHQHLPAITHGICPRCAAMMRAECVEQIAV